MCTGSIVKDSAVSKDDKTASLQLSENFPVSTPNTNRTSIRLAVFAGFRRVTDKLTDIHIYRQTDWLTYHATELSVATVRSACTAFTAMVFVGYQKQRTKRYTVQNTRVIRIITSALRQFDCPSPTFLYTWRVIFWKCRGLCSYMLVISFPYDKMWSASWAIDYITHP